jgi:hypothetical protein
MRQLQSWIWLVIAIAVVLAILAFLNFQVSIG